MARKRAKSPAKKPKKKAPLRRAKAAPVRARELKCYHVDAFTGRRFHGNPAAVVMLESKWLPDEVMQSIGAEHNLPMTAFVLRGKGKTVGLRWFNAHQEFELCGHATLAAAHAMWTHEQTKGSTIEFKTMAGDLAVSRDEDRIVLQFPARPPVRVRITNDLCAALGREPSEVHVAGSMLLAVFDNKRAVHELDPDMARLARLEPKSITVTAPGAGHDFVSRHFAPRHGLNEDHATGSSHCALVPYWAQRLKKKELTSHQVSHRGGEFWCELKGDRVLIGGHAITFARGTISV